MWQGAPPSSINLAGMYNLANNRRDFIWNTESPADIQYMDRLNEVGLLETYPAIDRTSGLQMTFARDLEGFRHVLEERGLSQAQIESSIDLRRRAMQAPNRQAARTEAIRWQMEQTRVDDR